MKKILALLILAILFFVINLYGESFKYNPFTGKLDKVNDKAVEISVEDVDSYFGDTAASPPTVESALKELAASKTVIDTTYLKLDASNDPLTGNLDLGSYNLTTIGEASAVSVITGYSTPTPSSIGTEGTIKYDSDYLYIRISNNQWKRVALSSWSVEVNNIISSSGNQIISSSGNLLVSQP